MREHPRQSVIDAVRRCNFHAVYQIQRTFSVSLSNFDSRSHTSKTPLAVTKHKPLTSHAHMQTCTLVHTSSKVLICATRMDDAQKFKSS